MLSSATSSNGATGASRLLSVLLLAALLCLLLGAGSEVNAQQLTTFTDTDAAVITTNLPPTVYTTEGQVYTWTATTPSTVTPVTFSTGSVMDAADYLRSKSMATALSQGPSQTASLRSGKPNILAVNSDSASSSSSSSSGGGRIAIAIAVAASVGGVLAAGVGTFGVL
ncbi:hypothetical protein JCM8115_003330 [Rhodotorula mucilaginosa]|uniref:Uncharacterized protein n=1 Tax=Rhodotorula mucilaginosa TaxID=5537 RepID=A0A9P6W2K6_RHOMI|nr:hypothetical protein C6P46_004432 [Rhodotorula mucilaginosa]